MSNRKSHTNVRRTPKLSRTLAAMFARADAPMALLSPTPEPKALFEVKMNRRMRRRMA